MPCHFNQNALSFEAGKEIPPELNNGELEFEYIYDLSGFFKQFPFISATALAKRLGINEGLMRRYKSGCAPVGEMQKNIGWYSCHRKRTAFRSILSRFCYCTRK